MTVLSLLLKQVKTVLSYVPYRNLSKAASDSVKWKRVKQYTDAAMPASRADPVITKLDSPEFRSIFSPELETLVSLFKKHNHEIRIAGGAVRDILMGITPKDLDFASTATPDEMKQLFTFEGIRMLNTKGEKHGTITARINDAENFEITTLRIDVVTDGRHADIEFTTDWKLDASRRDLTINSMYLDLDGRVFDFFFGYEDLKNRRVAFVGDPATRIQEDFLRILRYFRFYGRIAENPSNHDEATIKAIVENVEGLERISGERIWMEWSKILEGNFAVELMLKMLQCNIAQYIGLPEHSNLENFKKICERAHAAGHKLHPITMIAAMLKNPDDAMNLHERLKLSAYQRDLAVFVTTHRDDELLPYPLYPFQCQLLKSNKPMVTKEYIKEVIKYLGNFELLKPFEEWNPPKFPVNGHDLKPHVTYPVLIAHTINALKDSWLLDGCKTSKEELMKRAPDIVVALQEKYKPLIEKIKNKEKPSKKKGKF
ncbi:GSCOCG00006640001-RA-CDS [Cotesia congregata]|uniref:Mitochondrial (Mus musculus) n=1 Tax=Cotesia congregata TaxID=51543 RepID=A0A8J2HMP1_COTCN|nr:GSCOCG00006640001-RA-CDS [Cotesia congregata]CAG5106132.1 Similar to Trnt1: CCA tRNA nucleotidyltransferase 1 [Cotesia congregata]